MPYLPFFSSIVWTEDLPILKSPLATPTYARAHAYWFLLGGETKVIRATPTLHVFRACVYISTYVRVARVNACKRVHTLPAAFSLSQNLSQTWFSVGFCEDTTEIRTKKVKLLQRCLPFFPNFFCTLQALSFQGIYIPHSTRYGGG